MRLFGNGTRLPFPSTGKGYITECLARQELPKSLLPLCHGETVMVPTAAGRLNREP